MPAQRPALQRTAQPHCTPNDPWGQYYNQAWLYYNQAWPWQNQPAHGTWPAHGSQYLVGQWNNAWQGAQPSHTQPLAAARHTARPLTTDDASSNSGYEYSESESEESSASEKTTRRADMTTNNTEATEETDKPVLQVRIVTMSSEEKKEMLRSRLTEACSSDVDILIVTLDRSQFHRTGETPISEARFRQCLDVEATRSLESSIFSDNRATNIAVYWNTQSCNCTGFQQVPITGTTSPAPSAYHFQLHAPQCQETIDCAVMQVEVNTETVATIQGVWSRLKYPCIIAGNLLAPAGYLHAWMPHNKDEKKRTTSRWCRMMIAPGRNLACLRLWQEYM